MTWAWGEGPSSKGRNPSPGAPASSHALYILYLPLVGATPRSCHREASWVSEVQVLSTHSDELWLPGPCSHTGAGRGAGALVGYGASGLPRVGGGIQPLEASLPCALQGEHLVGKYCCLLCPKEFSSESGVKYHILKTHAEVGWAESLVGLAGDWATVGVVG